MATQSRGLRARRLAAGLIASGAVLWAAPAGAFCRTTTCIPQETCEYDPVTGCAINGIPLEWKSSCVSFGVQQHGSPLRDISFDEAHRIIQTAYSKWLGSPCDGGNPTLTIADMRAVACDQPQYNQTGPNANVWMFRDAGWDEELPSNVLAITIINFQPDTGEIFDADVEINSQHVPLATEGGPGRFDLPAIVTHEAGHFLGLSHSLVPGATMRAGYDPSMSELSSDDHAGMCEMYPPDRDIPEGNCSPRRGFTSACFHGKSGCSFGAAPGSPAPWGSALPFAVALFAGIGARRRRRPARS